MWDRYRQIGHTRSNLPDRLHILSADTGTLPRCLHMCCIRLAKHHKEMHGRLIQLLWKPIKLDSERKHKITKIEMSPWKSNEQQNTKNTNKT